MQRRFFAVIAAPFVAAVALLFAASPASAHEVIVVCDEQTGDLVWSVTPDSVPATVTISNGSTINVSAGQAVTTPHPGPGTWVAAWANGETSEGVLPPECAGATTTSAAPASTSPTTSGAPTTSTTPVSTAPTSTLPASPTGGPSTSEAATEVAANTVVPPAGGGSESAGGSASGSGTLPATGSGATLAVVAVLLIGAGIVATTIARRSART